MYILPLACFEVNVIIPTFYVASVNLNIQAKFIKKYIFDNLAERN